MKAVGGTASRLQSLLALLIQTHYMYHCADQGFLAILGMGPRAFLIKNICVLNPEFGEFSEHSKLMKYTNLLKVIFYSCIDVYVHSCLNPFSIGRKTCSNSKT